jgi:hypothetical protein
MCTQLSGFSQTAPGLDPKMESTPVRFVRSIVATDSPLKYRTNVDTQSGHAQLEAEAWKTKLYMYQQEYIEHMADLTGSPMVAN